MFPSSPSCGQRDGDAAEAEVDHGGEVLPVGVAVAAPVDEADLGVDALEAAVGEPVADGVHDAVEVAVDPAGEVGHGGQAAVDTTADPVAEVAGGVVWGDGLEQGAELFFELPGGEQLGPVGLDGGEELAMPGAESFAAGTQRVAGGAPVAAGELAASAVDGLEHRVDRFVGPAHEVERVEADRRLGHGAAGGVPVDGRHVHRHRLDPGTSFRAEGVEEPLQCLLRSPFGDPDDTAGVVVGDHGQVAVPALVGDLVDTDVAQPIEPAVIEPFGDDASHDPLDRLPRTAQQPADARLVGALSQPGDEVLEQDRVPGPGPCPGHLLGPDPTASPAVDPGDVGFVEHLRRGEVQVPPPSPRPVIPRPGRRAARAAMRPTGGLQLHHQHVALDGEIDHPGTRDAQDQVQCSHDAHVRCASWFGWFWRTPNLGSSHVRVVHHSQRPTNLNSRKAISA